MTPDNDRSLSEIDRLMETYVQKFRDELKKGSACGEAVTDAPLKKRRDEAEMPSPPRPAAPDAPGKDEGQKPKLNDA